MGRKGSNKKLNSSVIDRESRDVEARVPIAVSNSVVSLKDTWSYSKPPKPRQFGETRISKFLYKFVFEFFYTIT